MFYDGLLAYVVLSVNHKVMCALKEVSAFIRLRLHSWFGSALEVHSRSVRVAKDWCDNGWSRSQAGLQLRGCALLRRTVANQI